VSGRYDHYVEKVRAMLIDGPAELESGVRRAIVDRDMSGIPAQLKPYVLKVALHAYKVEDEDITSLKRDRMTEDQIFEATAAAAVGAALLRLGKGMAALRGGVPEER
jgi:threonine synthase